MNLVFAEALRREQTPGGASNFSDFGKSPGAGGSLSGPGNLTAPLMLDALAHLDAAVRELGQDAATDLYFDAAIARAIRRAHAIADQLDGEVAIIEALRLWRELPEAEGDG